MRALIKQLTRGVSTLLQLTHWQAIYRFVRAKGGTMIVSKPKARSVLILASHPDDDVFGLGGTLALLAKSGSRINVVYIANGCRGTRSGKVSRRLIGMRQKEGLAALSILGGAEATFWSLDDGSLKFTAYHRKQLAELVARLENPLIFVPWSGDNHPDHQAVFWLLTEIIEQLTDYKGEIWQYEIWSGLIPNRLVTIQSVLEQKRQAIRAHTSQLADRDYEAGVIGLNTYRGAMANLKGPAEAFFALPAAEFRLFVKSIEPFRVMKKTKSF